MSTTAIVILNWNGKHFLERFFHLLELRSEIPGVSIVVADNGSTDGSVDYIKKAHPSVRIIEFDTNYGFTGGYNKALAQVEADYFLLLNSDVEVTNGWLGPLIENMDSYSSVGICMPKIKSAFDHDSFEYAGACGGFLDVLGFPFCRGRILSNIENDRMQYNQAIEVFWASGAAMMIRSELYRSLGGFDELFFAHMEEIDLCWRAKLAGWQVWVFPESVVYHVGGGTLPNNSPHKLYLNYRNNLLMLHKNLPAGRRRLVIFARLIIDGLSAVTYILQGKALYFASVFRAHIDFYWLRHKTKRSEVPVNRKISGIYKGSIVFSFFWYRKKLRYLDIGPDIS
ncbi:MAG: glycosyl transferase family 2 [Bacteroidetes bacterium GWF2_40_14]|nr:MAG: glycosyl transferase family 2 [Bacteroidetes bacterium GWF2_40_14]